MESIGQSLKIRLEASASTSSRPYWEMEAEERRAYYQRKCDRSNAEIGELNKHDGIDCPECRNKGVIYCVLEEINPVTEQPEMSVGLKPCKCKAARASAKRMRASGLGDIISKCTFDTFTTQHKWQADMKNLAMQFVDRGQRVFFIGGQSGCGKTHICTAITVELIRRSRAAHYMLWAAEAVKLKAAAMDQAEYAAMIDHIKNVDVLYIDDFLKPVGENPQPTAADIRLAYEIINHRYNNAKQITIISSERTTRELLRIDEATAGRIIEYAEGYMIDMARDVRRNYRLRGILEGA